MLCFIYCVLGGAVPLLQQCFHTKGTTGKDQFQMAIIASLMGTLWPCRRDNMLRTGQMDAKMNWERHLIELQ